MRVLIGLTILLTASCLSASGWTQAEPSNQPKKKSLEERVADLEERVEFLSGMLGDIVGRQHSDSVFLDCGKRGYGVLVTEGSKFQILVSCEDVTPFLEGHKIKLDIGNPYYAHFEGVEIIVRYGLDATDSWVNNKSVALSLTERLKAGAWRRVEVVINPSKAPELRYLAVSIRAKETILIARPN